MTKKVLSIATIAILAVGTAMFISCNKEDEFVNDIPIMKPKVADRITEVESAVVYSWLHYVEEPNGAGGVFYREVCLESRSKIICGISPQHLITTENTVILTSLVEDGIIKTLFIDSTNMPKEDRLIFENYVESGVIKFIENSPIKDPKLLKVVKNNYIPAGVYPIIKEGSSFVINLSI